MTTDSEEYLATSELPKVGDQLVYTGCAGGFAGDFMVEVVHIDRRARVMPIKVMRLGDGLTCWVNLRNLRYA